MENLHLKNLNNTNPIEGYLQQLENMKKKLKTYQLKN